MMLHVGPGYRTWVYFKLDRIQNSFLGHLGKLMWSHWLLGIEDVGSKFRHWMGTDVQIIVSHFVLTNPNLGIEWN